MAWLTTANPWNLDLVSRSKPRRSRRLTRAPQAQVLQFPCLNRVLIAGKSYGGCHVEALSFQIQHCCSDGHACALFALPALADSQARIVRLSDVQGSVQIDKNTGIGFESAFLNLPITQGTQMRTHDRGRAEIEFEDGSTLRLTPNTTVEFSTLGLSDAGKRISVINLVEGMAYVNWIGKDDLSLNFSREKVSIDRAGAFPC